MGKSFTLVAFEITTLCITDTVQYYSIISILKHLFYAKTTQRVLIPLMYNSAVVLGRDRLNAELMGLGY